MKKMKLSLDELAIESFDTTMAHPPRGTVIGEQNTDHVSCQQTCKPVCYESFDGTCVGGQATCGDTCDSCAETQCLVSCACPAQ